MSALGEMWQPVIDTWLTSLTVTGVYYYVHVDNIAKYMYIYQSEHNQSKWLQNYHSQFLQLTPLNIKKLIWIY